MGLWVRNGGVWHQCGTSTAVHAAGAWHPLKVGLVRVAGVWQAFFFAGQTDTYNAHGTFTETIPYGAKTLTLDLWGATGSGGAGAGSGCILAGGGGGGSGGYSRTVLTINPADWGKTISVTIGTGGAASNNPGTASSIASGTYAITAMNAPGGGGGGNAPNGFTGGAAGAAGAVGTGGNSANSVGNAGQVGSGLGGANGGAGVVGTNGTGPAGGLGSAAGAGHAGHAGLDGQAIFAFT